MPFVTFSFEDHDRDIESEVSVEMDFVPRVGESIFSNQEGYGGLWEVIDVVHYIVPMTPGKGEAQEVQCVVYVAPLESDGDEFDADEENV